jgi:hypothetical protein
MSHTPSKSPSQLPLARSVPLARLTSPVGGGSAFYDRLQTWFNFFAFFIAAIFQCRTG